MFCCHGHVWLRALARWRVSVLALWFGAFARGFGFAPFCFGLGVYVSFSPFSSSLFLSFSLQSAADVSFWADFGDLKLNVLRLSTGPVPLRPQIRLGQRDGQGGVVECDQEALSLAGGDGVSGDAPRAERGCVRVRGSAYAVNALSELKAFDRKGAVDRAMAEAWAAVESGSFLADPAALVPLVAVVCCDLKKVRFWYWFAFPSFKGVPYQVSGPVQMASEAFAGSSLGAFLAAASARSPADPFVWAYDATSGAARELVELDREIQSQRGGASEETFGLQAALSSSVSPALSSTNPFSVPSRSSSAFPAPIIVLLDPGSVPDAPGWPARALLVALAARWRLERLTLVCLRSRRGVASADASPVFSLQLDPEGWREAVWGRGDVGRDDEASRGVPEGVPASPEGATEGASHRVRGGGDGGQSDSGADWDLQHHLSGPLPPVVGAWEPNARGRPGPRLADLGSAADPVRLAQSAVQLNLSLMRWRASPSLDLASIASARCLLLGAGTLGCAVARTLLAWGVSRLTLVDSGRVSYSNPVRQSLFEHADCLHGGKPKAQAAAAALARIFPGVDARGVALAIPMPGHPPGGAIEERECREAVKALQRLFDEHDVVFLLTDSRESRWLPSLLAANDGRILAVDAALGFDTYLVMRHGRGFELRDGDMDPARETERRNDLRVAVAGQGDQHDGDGDAGTNEGSNADGFSSFLAAAAISATPPAQATLEGALSSLTLVQDTPVDEEDDPTGRRKAERASPPPTSASPLRATASPSPSPSPLRRARLGCYFCNDVVAPQDSLTDRSLDQQCTVARPGLAAIAGSLAVELVAAERQHRAGRAGEAGSSGADEASAPAALGPVPHMLRGSLTGFRQQHMTGHAYRQCTACSEAVVGAYRRGGVEFVMQAVKTPSMLEDITGLTELHRAAEQIDDDAWDDDDDDDGEL